MIKAALSFFQFVPAWCYGLLAVIALLIGVETHGRHHERKIWEAREAAIARLNALALAAVTARNDQIKIDQKKTESRITIGLKDENTKLRADVAANRLRKPSASCTGTAAGPTSKSNAGNDAADPGTELVSESTQRDFEALQLKVGETFASCRALQDFVRSNNLGP